MDRMSSNWLARWKRSIGPLYLSLASCSFQCEEKRRRLSQTMVYLISKRKDKNESFSVGEREGVRWNISSLPSQKSSEESTFEHCSVSLPETILFSLDLGLYLSSSSSPLHALKGFDLLDVHFLNIDKGEEGERELSDMLLNEISYASARLSFFRREQPWRLRVRVNSNDE